MVSDWSPKSDHSDMVSDWSPKRLGLAKDWDWMFDLCHEEHLCQYGFIISAELREYLLDLRIL